MVKGSPLYQGSEIGCLEAIHLLTVIKALTWAVEGGEVQSCNGFFMQSHGFGDYHVLWPAFCLMEWNKTTDSVGKISKHTFGVCLSHFNANLNDVFLLYRGGIKWSAITSGQYQNTHLVKEFYFITLECDHGGCQSSSQWMKWTLQGKERDISSKDGYAVYSEQSADYHNGMSWNHQISLNIQQLN